MTANDLHDLCVRLAGQAKAASRRLAVIEPRRKNEFLLTLAKYISEAQAEILAANEKDVAGASTFGLTKAQVDRLKLTPARLEAIARGLAQIADLPEPIGQVLDGTVRPNGLRVNRVSVPLGVILFLYESRPNVTIDAAALAIKSGNAIILRGGKEAWNSNHAFQQLIVSAAHSAGIPDHAAAMVPTLDRDAVGHLLQLNQYIDLVIPRGGEALIDRVTRVATMPVMKHYRGNCHVYVDQSADLDAATRIIINAKCQRPGVCNAAESLLVHQAIADWWLPQVGQQLVNNGVQVRGCSRTISLIPVAQPATEEDYAAEFLDLILSVRVVDSIDTALDHIQRFGSGHTEAIVATDVNAVERFAKEVDAAAVMVNASTRFHDGFEFGLGAEIGISTDKFHARGPCGLRELTSYKYVVYGSGQIRE
jgi:glutamate-5-semialdehyde dehydrogenase